MAALCLTSSRSSHCGRPWQRRPIRGMPCQWHRLPLPTLRRRHRQSLPPRHRIALRARSLPALHGIKITPLPPPPRHHCQPRPRRLRSQCQSLIACFSTSTRATKIKKTRTMAPMSTMNLIVTMRPRPLSFCLRAVLVPLRETVIMVQSMVLLEEEQMEEEQVGLAVRRPPSLPKPRPPRTDSCPRSRGRMTMASERPCRQHLHLHRQHLHRRHRRQCQRLYAACTSPRTKRKKKWTLRSWNRKTMVVSSWKRTIMLTPRRRRPPFHFLSIALSPDHRRHTTHSHNSSSSSSNATTSSTRFTALSPRLPPRRRRPHLPRRRRPRHRHCTVCRSSVAAALCCRRRRRRLSPRPFTPHHHHHHHRHHHHHPHHHHPHHPHHHHHHH